MKNNMFKEEMFNSIVNETNKPLQLYSNTVSLLNLADTAWYLYNQIGEGERGDVQSLEELDLGHGIDGVTLFSNDKPFNFIRDHVKNLKSFAYYMIDNLTVGNKIPFKFMLDNELNIYIYSIDLEEVALNTVAEGKMNPINFAMFKDEVIEDPSAEISINKGDNYNFIKYIKIPDFVAGVQAPLCNIDPEITYKIMHFHRTKNGKYYKSYGPETTNIDKEGIGLEDFFFPIYSKDALNHEKVLMSKINKSIKELDEECGLEYNLKPFSLIKYKTHKMEGVHEPSKKTLIVLRYYKGQEIDFNNLINDQDEQSPDPNKTTGVYMAEIKHQCNFDIMVCHGYKIKEINGFKIMEA